MTQVSKNKAPVENPPVATSAVPSFMTQYVGQGTEDLSSNDVEVPRIKLLQSVSPELTELDDVKQGEFLHTVGEISLGKELRIVPLYIWQMFILWNPRDQGGGILARANDGVHWNPPNGNFNVKINKGTKEVVWRLAPTVAASKLDQWGTYDPTDQKSPPAATRMYCMVAYLPDHPGLSPVVITLQRSAIKVARRFLGKLKITRAPSYGMFFTMSSEQDRNPAGDNFWNYKFTGAGFVEDLTEFNAYRELYEQFKASGVNIKGLDEIGGEDDIPTTSQTIDHKDF